MSASDTLENDLLKLIFNNVAMSGIGDAGGLPGSASAGALYVALHTADPGETGNQATNETTYAGYARVAVPRAALNWQVTNNAANNADAVTFADCTGGAAQIITHFSIGTALTGAGKRLFSGALANPASLSVSAGIAPSFKAGQLIVTAD